MDHPTPSILVVGGGPAGLSAAIFTGRAGLPTTVVTGEGSILRRNALLENYPGFPGGVNARTLLSMMAEQATEAGCTLRAGRVTRLAHGAEAFEATVDDGDDVAADVVIVATKNEVGFLDPIEDLSVVDRGKPFVEADDRGRTGVDGLYVAGRLAGRPHQAVIAAGHGAAVAVTALEDLDRPFYHDWVAPEGYFTGRGRDVPPGCLELADAERRRRERSAHDRLRSHLEAVPGEPPEQHPSVRSP